MDKTEEKKFQSEIGDHDSEEHTIRELLIKQTEILLELREREKIVTSQGVVTSDELIMYSMRKMDGEKVRPNPFVLRDSAEDFANLLDRLGIPIWKGYTMAVDMFLDKYRDFEK